MLYENRRTVDLLEISDLMITRIEHCPLAQAVEYTDCFSVEG